MLGHGPLGPGAIHLVVCSLQNVGRASGLSLANLVGLVGRAGAECDCNKGRFYAAGFIKFQSYVNHIVIENQYNKPKSSLDQTFDLDEDKRYQM